MTSIPERATLCTCWRDAGPRRRAEEGIRQGTFAPLALRDCERCRGAGWFIAEAAQPPVH